MYLNLRRKNEHMFGIDLGITISSVSCISPTNEIIDHYILFGDTKNKDNWKRVVDMSEAIVDAVCNIPKGLNGVTIAPMVSIEEPVFPYRTKNPNSFLTMCYLFALTRHKLTVRGFDITSVNPMTVKARARKVFKGKKLKTKYMVRGKLTKTGMIRAYSKLIGKEPEHNTKAGRETLADSFWIAKAGIEKKRLLHAETNE